MMDRDKALENGLIVPTDELCTGYHNDESPAWDEKACTLADRSTAGFDSEQAVKKIAQPISESYDPAATQEAD